MATNAPITAEIDATRPSQSRFAARSVLVGNVGRDDLGEQARADLAAGDVDVSSLGTGTESTGVALILVDEHGENLIGVASGANMQLTAGQVTEAVGSVPVGP